MQEVKVELGERGYAIYIGHTLLQDIGKIIRGKISRKKVCILSNPVIWDRYSETIVKSLRDEGLDVEEIIIPPGEKHKNLTTVGAIYDRLIDIKMERESPVIAFGGGIVGDIGGFVAATYLRGVPFFQIPTTLLSQVDSSVGGKTGVNHPKGKNLIGAFYQPLNVVIDIATLQTLPQREIVAGIAEVIKYGIIDDDVFFGYLEENIEKLVKLDRDVLIHCIKRSCEIKARIVSKDEKESGIRAILNFGHTFAHAIESVTSYKVYLHGEAVAIGMVMAAHLSSKMGLCGKREAEQVVSLIQKSGLPCSVKGLDPDTILDAMALDKKVRGGKVRFILMTGIGSVEIHSDIERSLIREVV